MNRLISENLSHTEGNMGFNCRIYVREAKDDIFNICQISFCYPQVIDFLLNHDGLDKINIDRLNLYGKDPIPIDGNNIIKIFENPNVNRELIIDLVEGWLNSEVLNQDAVILLERKKNEISELAEAYSKDMDGLIKLKYENEELRKRINDMENAAGKLFFKNIVAPAQGQVVYSMPLSKSGCNETAD